MANLLSDRPSSFNLELTGVLNSFYREPPVLLVETDVFEVSAHPAILRDLGVSSHPFTTVTICRCRSRWKKISLGSPRPLNSPKIKRCCSRRRPRIGQCPRIWVTRIYSSRHTPPPTSRGQNHRYRRRAHEGTDGVHREEEAEKGLQEDHPAQADLHPPTDRFIRVPATTDTILVYYNHNIECQPHNSIPYFYLCRLFVPVHCNSLPWD